MSKMPLSDWIEVRRDGAIKALRTAVSATDVCRHRTEFGSQVRPSRGSVVASPRMANWNPEPDYFHHWVRDAAVVMRVLPDILKTSGPEDTTWWCQAFMDYVAFSLQISDPDQEPLPNNPLKASTQSDYRKYLRPDRELRALTGASRLGEPRCAADGTPDLERWNRPQDDGPALRASGVLAVLDTCPRLATNDTNRLLQRDLAHLCHVAGRPCIGPWEEAPPRRDSFTLISQWDALIRGAAWRNGQGLDGSELQKRAREVLGWIELTADQTVPAWRASVESAPGSYDSATILAILHAGQKKGPLAITAPRTRGTVVALEAQFRALYPINKDRDVPAMGRFASDVFFEGNPWFPVTLGFAELHYDIAAHTRKRDAFERADAWMALIREVIPDGDAIPEQFDRATGAPVSCLGLSWSAAAFVGAASARARALSTWQEANR